MTNSSNLDCKIGDRIECSNSFGTIKYIGPIEGRSGIWLGIDWDDPDRGKHNGTINEVQYFQAKSATSASFVRPEKVNFGKSAIFSIESRYGQAEDEFTAKINQQKHLLVKQTINAPFLEMVGFDKVFNKQSDFNSLRIVNLRNQNVSWAGIPLKLGKVCPNIEELDISKNLFVSWNDIFEICNQLPKLYWLNVSENLLDLPDDLKNVDYPTIRTLICGHMHLNWETTVRIVKLFPNLEEFRAPYNEIESLTEPLGFFNNIKLLDLEGNDIREWSEVCKLGMAPFLEHLNLEKIQLQTIQFQESEFQVSIFINLKKLCLVNNLINEWLSIGELNRLPKLQHLKITKNPITESEPPDTIHQILIAKIANLQILNGVEIETGERRGAEYDYIKKYGLEWLKVKNSEERHKFLKEHNRYMELIEKYGEPEESELIVKPQLIKSSLIKLNLVFEDNLVEKKIPPTVTIQKLMVLSQNIFRLSDRPQLTYASSTDTEIEISLDDEAKEIGYYSMQDGDKIIVKQ